MKARRMGLVNLLTFTAFFALYFVFYIKVLALILGDAAYLAEVQALFSLAIAGSLAVAALIKKRYSLRTAAVSLLITILAVVSIPFVPGTAAKLILAFSAAISFGFGQLAALTNFWASTATDSRGVKGGRIAFGAILVYFIAAIVVEQTDLLLTVIVALIPSIVALVLILSLGTKASLPDLSSQKLFYRDRRTVLLYSIPWILFTLINATLARNISSPSTEIIPSQASYVVHILLLQTFASLVGALSGGMIADWFGRRPSLALTVSLYGVSLVLSVLFQNILVFFFALAAESFSFGVLLTLYSFVIWGDLSNKENVSKMYAIGLAIFYIATAAGLVLPASSFSPISSALIGCLIIFLSNLPIMLAPELLPASIREKRRMKKYIEKIAELRDQPKSQG